ncbi:MAG: HDOD domain-containing protein [Opitutae bacterium]|nr:HDOD domain-containing protein [Opitutae bacterium]
MANILLLDDSEVAGRAMRGILARGNHRCVLATDAGLAWTQLRQLVKIDVLILELKLKGENGISFLQRLRADCFLKHLPVVVYTSVGDHNVVKKALSLTIQNYLIKPYNDEAIFSEIAKSIINPWRNLHFEEARSFCAQMGFSQEELRHRREQLKTMVEENIDFFLDCASKRDATEFAARVATISESAEAAGVWCVVEYLGELQAKVAAADWASFKLCREPWELAARLIHCQLNPEYLPDGLISDQERQQQQEAREKAVWLGADVQHGPIVRPKELEQKLDNLPGFPVIDTVAAGFQMAADGQPSSLNHLMDLVAKDPGLTAQVLMSANKIDRGEMTSLIDDPRLASSLLGDLKLNALAKALSIVEERHMRVPPISWAHFWMFQVGVARLAQYTCKYLEFPSMVSSAYTAGILHDVGKLILLRLYPFGFQAMVEYSRKHSVPLHVAEKKYLGWTTREMADYFARKNGLPVPFCNVIRWVETPEEATEDAELVAIVSLSRDICLHNHVGYCGDTPKDQCPPIGDTTAWSVLRSRVFPSFNLRNFETQAHAYCRELKQELAGRIK